MSLVFVLRDWLLLRAIWVRAVAMSTSNAAPTMRAPALLSAVAGPWSLVRAAARGRPRTVAAMAAMAALTVTFASGVHTPIPARDGEEQQVGGCGSEANEAETGAGPGQAAGAGEPAVGDAGGQDRSDEVATPERGQHEAVSRRVRAGSGER